MKLNNSIMKSINLFRLQRQLALFLLIFTVSATGAWAQKVITGNITDSDNNPLPGVNVTIKGTLTGTISDLDGNYSIAVSSDTDVLTFSMMGMLPEEIEVGAQSTINIQLNEDLIGLEEVVVVGYGTMKKSDISGAIVSATEEEITEVKALNAMESLQGKMAGVDITPDGGRTGAGVDIVIRGTRSIKASNDPLFIVDGIPYGSSIDLNPNDIESIEVLKDASSTAIYGSRGANGVVLVTTKKGKAGKAKVFFNAFYGITQPYQKVPVFDREGYIQAKYDAYTDWETGDVDSSGAFVGNEAIGLENGTETDWQDVTTQNGIRQEYQVGIMGGNEKTVYNTSISYYNEKGVTLADKYKRYTFKINLDNKVTDFLNVGGSALVIYSERDGRGVRFTDAILSSPIVPAFDSTGKYIYEANFPNPRKNPLAFTDDSQVRTRQRILSNVYASVNIIPGLNFRTSFGVIFENTREGWAYPEKVKGIDTPEAGVTLDKNFDYTWTNLLSYNKSLGVHSFSAMLGHEVRQDRYEGYYMWGEYPTFQRTLWWNMGAIDGATEMSSNLIESALVSVFGRATYNYNDLVIVNGSVRTDGASQLADDNKWDVFPSISSAFRIKNFSFMQDIERLSDLKLRIGYGVSGNAAVDPYATAARLNKYPIYYEFGEPGAEEPAPGYRPEFLSSDNLHWEITKQYNIGMDLGLFSNRVSLNLDAYQSETSDVLLQTLLPLSTGFFDIWTNTAVVETKGFEMMLSTTNINRGDFQWDMNITFALDRDKVTKIAPGVSQQIADNLFVGESMNVVYDWNKIGIWQLDEAEEADIYNLEPGDIKIENITSDSVLNDDDRTFIGNERPKWVGSWINTFRYKGFDLTINMYARIGQTIDANAYSFDPRMYDNMLAHDYWTPNNPTNEAPRLDANMTEAPFERTLRYRDGSFVKLKNVTLGYNIPTNLLEKAKISKLRVYMSSQNPLILYSKIDKGVDPENNGSISWPLARTFVFGLNVEF